MRVQNQEELRFSPDELQSLMNDAIARHASAERELEERPHRLGSLATLEDALSIARDLDIPEEHILQAARERHRVKLREQRRWAVRAGRRNAFWLGLGLATVTSVVSLMLGAFTGGALSWLMVLSGASGLAVLFLAWRWLFAEVGDPELSRTDHIAVAGTCRVCGAPACNERATFCEDHRYKGPATSA